MIRNEIFVHSTSRIDQENIITLRLLRGQKASAKYVIIYFNTFNILYAPILHTFLDLYSIFVILYWFMDLIRQQCNLISTT